MRLSSLAGLLFCITGLAQVPERLPLKADLVLSPEFCAVKKRQSIAIKDVLNVGKAACPKLQDRLGAIFSDLRRVDTAPAAGTSTAQIVLIPKFVDVNSTQPLVPSSQRKLVITLEWTIQNSAGRPIWLQTVQGSSQHKLGWIVTKKGMTALVDAAIDDLAEVSVSKMSSARELRDLPK
jgi:hypothetical protein